MTIIREIQYTDSPSLDAFGRLRVSNTGQRFDTEFIYNLNPETICNIIEGTGPTATHNANTRDVTLAIVNRNNGSGRALYSHIDIPYTAGNSQLIAITSVLDFANIGTGTASFFLRSKISGSVVDLVNTVQSSWLNLKTGVNWNYAQIFEIDFQSLKVGRIRYGLNQSGSFIPVGSIVNDNIRNSGYWQSPSLPIFWRIYNDATYTYMECGYGDTENAIGFRYKIASNANATMKAICATVKSEGGVDILDIPGYNRAVDMGVTPKTVGNTLIPVLSIRPTATFNSLTNRGVYIPTGIQLETDQPILLRVYNGGTTLTGANWSSLESSDSGMEYDVAASAISGGTLIASMYLTAANNAKIYSSSNLLGKVVLAIGRDSTVDTLSICAVRTGNSNASVKVSIDWKEIR